MGWEGVEIKGDRMKHPKRAWGSPGAEVAAVQGISTRGKFCNGDVWSETSLLPSTLLKLPLLLFSGHRQEEKTQPQGPIKSSGKR